MLSFQDLTCMGRIPYLLTTTAARIQIKGQGKLLLMSVNSKLFSNKLIAGRQNVALPCFNNLIYG